MVSVALYNLTPGRGLTQPWCEPSPSGDQSRWAAYILCRASTNICPSNVLPVPILHLCIMEQVSDLSRHAQHLHQQQSWWWQQWELNLGYLHTSHAC